MTSDLKSSRKRSVELGDDRKTTFNVLFADGAVLMSIHGPGGHTAQWMIPAQAAAVADAIREVLNDG